MTIKSIQLSHKEWQRLKKVIREEYGDSVILITWRMRDVLGFTVRRHHGYDPVTGHGFDDIRLDFYDEVKKTWFIMKYM